MFDLRALSGAGHVEKHRKQWRWDVRSDGLVALIGRAIWPWLDPASEFVTSLWPRIGPAAKVDQCAQPECPYLRTAGPFCQFHLPLAIVASLPVDSSSTADPGLCACQKELDWRVSAATPLRKDQEQRPAMCTPCIFALDTTAESFKHMLLGDADTDRPGFHPALWPNVLWAHVTGQCLPPAHGIPVRYRETWRSGGGGR